MNYLPIINRLIEGVVNLLTISVCIGSACHLKGSYNVISSLQELINHHRLKEKIEIKGAFCLGNCTQAVSVEVDEKVYSVTPSNVEDFFTKEVLSHLEG